MSCIVKTKRGGASSLSLYLNIIFCYSRRDFWQGINAYLYHAHINIFKGLMLDTRNVATHCMQRNDADSAIYAVYGALA
jgi:hypothetical protein